MPFMLYQIEVIRFDLDFKAGPASRAFGLLVLQDCLLLSLGRQRPSMFEQEDLRLARKTNGFCIASANNFGSTSWCFQGDTAAVWPAS
jgi:hypothetical protein